jgi:hypothetical protein
LDSECRADLCDRDGEKLVALSLVRLEPLFLFRILLEE